MPPRTPNRLSPRIAIALLAAVTVVAVVAVLAWPPVAPVRPEDHGENATPPVTTEAPSKSAPPAEEVPVPPRVAIVVDDLGRDLAAADRLLATGEALTFSVLPFLPHSQETARRVHAAGEEVLLHLPMEPQAYPRIRPGRGGLLLSMDEVDLLHQLDEDLAAVPFIDGVNNHMGSHLTEEEAPMAVVMEQLASRGLFFLDSRTTPHSVATVAAAQAGVEWLSRDLFLDNDPHPESIAAQFDKLMDLALTRGHAIAIGHPHPTTLDALEVALPKLREKGIVVVPLVDLLPRTEAMWSPSPS